MEGKTLGYYHHFLWDRTRAIRNDFSIQQVSAVADVRLAIECFERIVRFHIIALHDLGTLDPKPYDLYDYQQDWEQCDKALLSLTTLYGRSRDRYRSPQEPEFWAYWILFHIQGRLPDTHERIQRLPAEIMADGRVKTALQIFNFAQNNMSNQGEVLFGSDQMPLHLVAAQMNWYKFFALVGSKRTSFLMACCAEVYFHHVRHTALRVIVQAYRRQAQDWTIKDLEEHFHFDSIIETKAFAEAYGLIQDEDAANETTPLDLSVLGGKDDFSTPAGYATRVFSDYLVESKRAGRNYSAVIDGMSVADARKAGKIDEPEEEMDDAPVSEDEQSLFVKADPPQSVLGQNAGTTNGIFGSTTPLAFGQKNSAAPTQVPNPFGAAPTTTSAFGTATASVQPNSAFGGAAPSFKFTAPSQTSGSPFQASLSDTAKIQQANASSTNLNNSQTQQQPKAQKPLFSFGSPATNGGEPNQQGNTPVVQPSQPATSKPEHKPATQFSCQWAPSTFDATKQNTAPKLFNDPLPPSELPRQADQPQKPIFFASPSALAPGTGAQPIVSPFSTDSPKKTPTFAFGSTTTNAAPATSIFPKPAPAAAQPPQEQKPSPFSANTSLAPSSSDTDQTQPVNTTTSPAPQSFFSQPSPTPDSALNALSSAQAGNQSVLQTPLPPFSVPTSSAPSLFASNANSVLAGSDSTAPKRVTFDFPRTQEQIATPPSVGSVAPQQPLSAITTASAPVKPPQNQAAKAARQSQAMEYLSRQLVTDLDHGIIARIVQGTVGDWVREEMRSSQIAKWKARAVEIEKSILSKKFCKRWYDKWRKSRMRSVARKRREHLKDSLRRSQSRSVSVIDEFRSMRTEANRDSFHGLSNSANDTTALIPVPAPASPSTKVSSRQSIRKTTKARQASPSISELSAARGGNRSMPNLTASFSQSSPLGQSEMLINSIRGPPRPDGKISTTKTPYFQWKARGLLGDSVTSNSLRSSTSSSGLRDSIDDPREAITSQPMTFSSPLRPPPVPSVAAGKRKLEDAADEDEARRKRTTHAPHSSADLGNSTQLRRSSLNSSTTSLVEQAEVEHENFLSRAAAIRRELDDGERWMVEMRQKLEQERQHGGSNHDFATATTRTESPLRSLPAYHFRNSKFVPRKMYGKWSPKAPRPTDANTASTQANTTASPSIGSANKPRPFDAPATSSLAVKHDAQQTAPKSVPSKVDFSGPLLFGKPLESRDQALSSIAHAAQSAAEAANRALTQEFNFSNSIARPAEEGILSAVDGDVFEDDPVTLGNRHATEDAATFQSLNTSGPRAEQAGPSRIHHPKVEYNESDSDAEAEDDEESIEEFAEEEGGYEDEDELEEDEEDLEAGSEEEDEEDLNSEDYDEDEDEDDDGYGQYPAYSNPAAYGSRAPAPASMANGPGKSADDAIELDSD